MSDTAGLPAQFGGYINVPGTEKRLYYLFVTSQGSPDTDPVVLWVSPTSCWLATASAGWPCTQSPKP